MLTLPVHEFVPFLPASTRYIRGQLEQGAEDGYLHWQIVVAFQRKVRLRAVREVFGPFHAELTRSDAARDYVWKDDTSVPNTRFLL